MNILRYNRLPGGYRTCELVPSVPVFAKQGFYRDFTEIPLIVNNGRWECFERSSRLTVWTTGIA
jgi:hypothetical protein